MTGQPPAVAGQARRLSANRRWCHTNSPPLSVDWVLCCQPPLLALSRPVPLHAVLQCHRHRRRTARTVGMRGTSRSASATIFTCRTAAGLRSLSLPTHDLSFEPAHTRAHRLCASGVTCGQRLVSAPEGAAGSARGCQGALLLWIGDALDLGNVPARCWWVAQKARQQMHRRISPSGRILSSLGASSSRGVAYSNPDTPPAPPDPPKLPVTRVASI